MSVEGYLITKPIYIYEEQGARDYYICRDRIDGAQVDNNNDFDDWEGSKSAQKL